MICTFCRSRSEVDSYSMLTYDSPPDTLGQQLMDSGTRFSCGKRTGGIRWRRARQRIRHITVPTMSAHRECPHCRGLSRTIFYPWATRALAPTTTTPAAT